MRGVSVDCTNRPPSWRRVRTAGLDAVRIEMRDLPEFYKYVAEFKRRQAWLVGPSTGPVEPILRRTPIEPDLIIIGNEPDLASDSSWSMEPWEYIELWNVAATRIRRTWPHMLLATAGMYSKLYLDSVWDDLYPQPDYCNLHYPEGISQFQEFCADRRGIVGEWTWRSATEQEMYDWVVHFLDYYAYHHFYFCWADYMVPGHGLLTAKGNFTKSYYYLRKALKS